MARASLIDFESFSVGPIAGDSVIVNVDGVDVMFSGPGLQIRDVSFLGAGADRTLSTTDDAGPITVEFLGGFTADSIDIQNWLPLGPGEVDYINGVAYNSSNVVLDTETNANSDFHLAGSGITKMVFQEGNPTEGFLLDNFSFNGKGTVPDSGLTAGMLGAVFAGLVYVRRKFVVRS